MKAEAPQIIYLSLTFMGLLYAAHKHGEKKKEEYNIFVSLVAKAIGVSILWWGGFF